MKIINALFIKYFSMWDMTSCCDETYHSYMDGPTFSDTRTVEMLFDVFIDLHSYSSVFFLLYF